MLSPGETACTTRSLVRSSPQPAGRPGGAGTGRQARSICHDEPVNSPSVAEPLGAVAAPESGELGGVAIIATLATAVLAVGAGIGPGALIAGVALLQAALVVGGVLATGLPGRWGGLVIAGAAAGGADVAVAAWPTSALSPLLAVLGLATPVMFIHQLARGVVRARVVESLSAIALLVVAAVALTAYVQLRNEYGGRAMVLGSVLAIGAALVAGALADLVWCRPRLDPQVNRGTPALVVGLAVGAAAAWLILRGHAGATAGLHGTRAAALGAGLGVLTAFLSAATGFATHGLVVDAATQPSDFAVVHQPVPWLRPALMALVPIALLAPVAYALALALG